MRANAHWDTRAARRNPAQLDLTAHHINGTLESLLAQHPAALADARAHLASVLTGAYERHGRPLAPLHQQARTLLAHTLSLPPHARQKVDMPRLLELVSNPLGFPHKGPESNPSTPTEPDTMDTNEFQRHFSFHTAPPAQSKPTASHPPTVAPARSPIPAGEQLNLPFGLSAEPVSILEAQYSTALDNYWSHARRKDEEEHRIGLDNKSPMKDPGFLQARQNLFAAERELVAAAKQLPVSHPLRNHAQRVLGYDHFARLDNASLSR